MKPSSKFIKSLHIPGISRRVRHSDRMNHLVRKYRTFFEKYLLPALFHETSFPPPPIPVLVASEWIRLDFFWFRIITKRLIKSFTKEKPATYFAKLHFEMEYPKGKSIFGKIQENKMEILLDWTMNLFDILPVSFFGIDHDKPDNLPPQPKTFTQVEEWAKFKRPFLRKRVELSTEFMVGDIIY